MGGLAVSVPQGLALGAYQSLVVETALEACRGGVDVVVELGSGWSRNLFLAWLAGGPREALYVGAELTDAGRLVADRVAALDPAFRFRSLAFDFAVPDLAPIAGHDRALVFTAHGADYVPELTTDLFEQVRSVAAEVMCVHFENFGWQVGDGLLAESAREYALANDYNRNLYELLQREQDAGRIDLVALLPNVFGFHRRYLTSVAVWRARP